MNNYEVSIELCSDLLKPLIVTQELSFVRTPENHH
jgi:hypothetical protein